MDMIIFLQALEPRGVFRLLFAALSWCGDGPVYFLLFPLLYWRKAPSIAVRYGYLWGWTVVVMTVLKGQTATLRPFLAAPEHVAFLQPPLAGFYWFPSQDMLIAAYRQSPAFPSGHALFATALGLYLFAHTASVGWRCLLGCCIVTIPLARLYLGVHYPVDVLAGSAVGLLLSVLGTSVGWAALARRVERWGRRWWHRHLLLAVVLTGGLAVVSTDAAVVWLLLLSYPVLLTVARQPIASFATDRGPVWRTYNAVGGCLGVGGLLLAIAPLLSLSTLLSVPLVTAWVTLGCPYLVQCVCPWLRVEARRPGRPSLHPEHGDQPIQQHRDPPGREC
jgi:membrane-associated phospholipid phosphatase